MHSKTGQEVYNDILNDDRPGVRYKDDARPIEDLKQMLESTAEMYPDSVAYYQKFKKGEPFTAITYQEFLEDVNAFGTALIDLGFKDERIAVMGDNSYMWCVSYLAVVCGTGVVVPLDKELKGANVKPLLQRSDTTLVIGSKKPTKMMQDIMRKGDTDLRCLINMDGKSGVKESRLEKDLGRGNPLSWWDVLEHGKKLVAQGDRRFIDAEIDREAMSILLFTSGTMGEPKGVMHSHATICCDVMIAPTVMKIYQTDTFFSFLPLHHTYENTCTFLESIFRGSAVAFCQGLKYLLSDMDEVKPTVFLTVPAILENVHNKIWKNAAKSGKDKALRKALRVNEFTKKLGMDFGGKFFKEIRDLFGGELRLIICGGAIINPDVLRDFRHFGFIAVQGYGLTECAPIAALNPDTEPVDSSIGKELPGVKLKIDNPNDEGIGEICVKGANLMLGYYNMPEKTAEVIKDGWYHTGDVGYADDEGYYYITGRMKNVIINKNGKNVYPEELEYQINQSPIIAESMVFQEEKIGSDDHIIAASIVLDQETLGELYGSSLSDEEIEKTIWAWIDELNSDAPSYSRIKQINIRREPLIKNTSQKVLRFEEGNKKGDM